MCSLIFISCETENTPKGFNKKLWLGDVKGCKGNRNQIIDSILLHKNEWKGMDDDKLLDLLGTPERKFYYERNAKAFLFYYSPGSQCDSFPTGKEGKKLIAEINATGFVNLIRTEP